MCEQFVDLHIHTTFSDDTFIPYNIIEMSAKIGLSTIVITDHNTMNTISDDLIKQAKNNIFILPGIEGIESRLSGYTTAHNQLCLSFSKKWR